MFHGAKILDVSMRVLGSRVNVYSLRYLYNGVDEIAVPVWLKGGRFYMKTNPWQNSLTIYLHNQAVVLREF